MEEEKNASRAHISEKRDDTKLKKFQKMRINYP